ncbi:MAG: hypothetical protein DMF70_16250 [Acidobacteria bacterium]|nr:MAG: hypothetical protein DMF70_16250 [Acidobacteriota bacterium]
MRVQRVAAQLAAYEVRSFAFVLIDHRDSPVALTPPSVSHAPALRQCLAQLHLALDSGPVAEPSPRVHL